MNQLDAMSSCRIKWGTSLFFAGVATAMLAPKIRDAVHGREMSLALVGFGAVAVAIVGFASIGMKNYAQLIATFVGPVVLLAVFVAMDYRFALPPRWHWIGLITYSVYLLHMPVLISFRLAGWIPPLWLFIAVVIGLSLLSYRYVELPAQRWIRALGRRRMTDRTAGVPI